MAITKQRRRNKRNLIQKLSGSLRYKNWHMRESLEEKACAWEGAVGSASLSVIPRQGMLRQVSTGCLDAIYESPSGQRLCPAVPDWGKTRDCRRRLLLPEHCRALLQARCVRWGSQKTTLYLHLIYDGGQVGRRGHLALQGQQLGGGLRKPPLQPRGAPAALPGLGQQPGGTGDKAAGIGGGLESRADRLEGSCRIKTDKRHKCLRDS